MKKIIDEISAFIDEWVNETLETSPDTVVKSWGFAELVNRQSKGNSKTTTQPIPMTINGTADRERISLDDKYQFISWIRLVSPTFSIDAPDDAWGLKPGRRKRMPLRIVIAHRVELGEDLVYDLGAAIPESIFVDGFDYVWPQQYTVDPDHETIYRTELGETVYELHRFPWNLYVINIDVDYIEGKLCPPEPETEYVEYDDDTNVLHEDLTPVEYDIT